MVTFDPYNALVPIFLETKAPQRVHQIGTAVFAEFDGEPFLYSAAHVTDDRSNGTLLVPTDEGLTPIEGYLMHVDLPPEIRRRDDHVDVAYYRLASSFARSLCHHFRPMPQARCEIISSALELGACSACGYPATKSGKNASGAFSSEIFSFRGVAASEDSYAELGLSPQHSIIIHFSRKRAIDRHTAKPFPTPGLRGVSGGGIFAWPEGAELSEDWSLPKLIGVFHSYYEKEGLIVGTHLVLLLNAVLLGRRKGFGGVA